MCDPLLERVGEEGIKRSPFCSLFVFFSLLDDKKKKCSFRRVVCVSMWKVMVVTGGAKIGAKKGTRRV